MIIGVVKETCPGERRVALVPRSVPSLTGGGFEVLIESGAGASAGFTDEAYSEKGAALGGRDEVFEKADVICQVRTLGANPDAGRADLDCLRRDQMVVGFAEPLTDVAPAEAMAEQGVTLFAMELMPRITRAQAMDALSSQATIQGYKAVLLAASQLPKMFPMLMTAAGTIAAAKCFVIGAGVAGLQAIATARRLGGVVEGYDIRPAVKEQVESLGAKFLVLELDVEAGSAEDRGGYARAMDDDFYRRQRELMGSAVGGSDVVVTTAAVPGKQAPVLVTAEMVKGMHPGSVIVDLAAERGGNCELTRPDETVVEQGVTILGPTNLPATVPHHASQMYARNVSAFLLHLGKEGNIELDLEDEITAGTLLTRDGSIVNPRVREALGLGKEAAEPAETDKGGEAETAEASRDRSEG